VDDAVEDGGEDVGGAEGLDDAHAGVASLLVGHSVLCSTRGANSRAPRDAGLASSGTLTTVPLDAPPAGARRITQERPWNRRRASMSSSSAAAWPA
jgi:hypothetical protein